MRSVFFTSYEIPVEHSTQDEAGHVECHVCMVCLPCAERCTCAHVCAVFCHSCMYSTCAYMCSGCTHAMSIIRDIGMECQIIVKTCTCTVKWCGSVLVIDVECLALWLNMFPLLSHVWSISA